MFGQDFICHICRKEIDGDYHRYTCDIASIDMVFYTCQGDCNKEFRGEYIEPFISIEPIKNRWDILDIR